MPQSEHEGLHRIRGPTEARKGEPVEVVGCALQRLNRKDPAGDVGEALHLARLIDRVEKSVKGLKRFGRTLLKGRCGCRRDFRPEIVGFHGYLFLSMPIAGRRERLSDGGVCSHPFGQTW